MQLSLTKFISIPTTMCLDILSIITILFLCQFYLPANPYTHYMHILFQIPMKLSFRKGDKINNHISLYHMPLKFKIIQKKSETFPLSITHTHTLLLPLFFHSKIHVLFIFTFLPPSGTRTTMKLKQQIRVFNYHSSKLKPAIG